MPAVASTATLDEAIKIRAWQVLHLVQLGFDISDAEAIMEHAESWHVPAEMLAQGCPVELIKDILV
jgi:hypothetical protein